MKSRRLSRRSLITGIGGVSLALPWLEAMSPIRDAYGQAAKPPLRFVAMITTDGVFPQRFWPRLPGEPLYPLDKLPTGGYFSGLQAVDSTDFVFQPGLEPLSRHRKDLLIIEGLDASGGPGHDQWPSMLTGRSGRNTATSMDQAIANKIAGDTKFKSLNLGVRTDNGIPFSCYDVDQPALQENDPQAVFDRVFSEVAPPDPTALNQLRAERKSVLDSALADITDLQKTVGKADRDKLQNYFDSIREVESRLLNAGGGTSCGRPKLDVPTQKEWWRNDDNIPKAMGAQLDMLAMAFACDLTRVATLSFGNNNCDVTLPVAGVKTGFHTLGHEPDSNFNAWNDVAKIDVWNAEQMAGFIDRLKAIPEGDGTVFDNTVVVWLNEMTRGDHDTGNIPHIMAGSAQGYFKTGRYLRLARGGAPLRGNYPKGRWSNDFKVSVLQSMGVTGSTFGDPAQCGGPLDVLRG